MKISVGVGVALSIVGVVGVVALMAKTDNQDTMNRPHSASSNSEKTEQNKVSEPNTVIIDNYEFGPNKITVKKSTKVTWINQDQDRHNVKPDQETSEFKAGPLLAKGEKYSVVFDTPGTFTYHCAPHPYMKASVEVTE